MIPIIEIEALLGYVEVDIKNGVQMNVPDWQNAVEKIRAWLDPQRSPTTRAPVQTDQDLAFYPGEFCAMVKVARNLRRCISCRERVRWSP